MASVFLLNSERCRTPDTSLIHRLPCDSTRAQPDPVRPAKMAMPRGPASVPLQPATLNMAKDGTQKVAVEASSLTQWIKNALLTQRYYWPLAVLTLAFEAVLTLFIVKKIPYTEIDFSTYMQQVHVFLSKGERDYTKITGDTGPCVYPAGHLYVYAVISKFSAGGVELRSVQYAFAALYLFSQAVMFAVYYYAEVR